MIIQNTCAVCTRGTVYNPIFQQCVCPNNQYMNNMGFCDSVNTVCPSGTYSQGATCVACAQGCLQCSSANFCTQCQGDGFTAVGGLCLTQCGDGIMIGN